MEPGSHRELDIIPLLQLFLNSCFTDTVCVTLFRTVVERAISDVHKLPRPGGIPRLLNIVVPAMTDSLFGLYWSERGAHIYDCP